MNGNFRIAELIEKETEAYLKQDPDPFDDRHPCRTHPSSTFGHLLKILFRNEEFMTKVRLFVVIINMSNGVILKESMIANMCSNCSKNHYQTIFNYFGLI